ncbi:hypothetical protein [Embleya sp. NPDC005971]|uniref:hypothetical protein n=1 Tax=Embleya sp. NPDC005971 TaxID=3156724 RepID=UPI0033EBBFC3
MPRYVINASVPEACVIIESDDLQLAELTDWAVFEDGKGTLLAVPRDQVHSIQRIDPEGTPPPTPEP